MLALSPCHALARPTSPKPRSIGADGERAAAIGHVVPHQAARFRHVDRLGDDESRDVAYLAVRVFAERDILNDFVERIARIELAECAAGDLLVLTCVAVRGARGAFAESRRDFFVNDDFGDARSATARNKPESPLPPQTPSPPICACVQIFFPTLQPPLAVEPKRIDVTRNRGPTIISRPSDRRPGDPSKYTYADVVNSKYCGRCLARLKSHKLNSRLAFL